MCIVNDELEVGFIVSTGTLGSDGPGSKFLVGRQGRRRNVVRK